ncbi:DUF3867 domain-containing protein [Clostridium paraputrificum]|uniref:DUF3867 domain-containing protein n=1 Tax=Clostridium paraputrificum TaxID=29363 RepID=UPI003D329F2B
MDDRIIDFNELKNKAKDKDVDKLEDYMYSLYYQMAEGKITMADFTKNIYKYMEENNISQDKFLNIQKKLMERYGFDSSIIDEQLKSAGINLADVGSNYESIRKTMGFQEKYKDRLTAKAVSVYFIKNDKNNLEIILEEENVILQSEGKIDLADIELNEFLCSYKKVREEKPLAIKVCEDIKEYNY